ncbi:bifunctional diaminohydroxyphosphoribosylaminopyrimidine deaminase/5-amino-6-(5-phosphoribosylamino)uracil reductase RibD [Candidatus Fukatsuia symbiotica]
MTDERYMARAVELALLGRFTTAPNPNVGCVIVREGKVIGEGYHLYPGEPHAEIYALRMAGKLAQGATVYVTLEPCCYHGRTPPCTDALIAAGVKRVVVAMDDPNSEVSGRGRAALAQAGILVEYGVMMAEAEAINPGFLKRMRTGLPYLQLKMAASLDGGTAMASGESKWITSEQARQDVQHFRAQSAAILSSSATVLADNPALTVRWLELGIDVQASYPHDRSFPSQGQIRQPTRIILDSRNRLLPQHKVIQQSGSCWLARINTDKQIWPGNVEQLSLPASASGVDLVSLMITLAKREINSVWVEAGAQLAGALLQAGLVDELILYLAPRLLGDHARGLCILPGLNNLADAPQFSLAEVRQMGSDLRLRLEPVRKSQY